jgi:tol-pal system protein YbgF
VGAYTPSISSAEFETRYQGALGLFNSRNYDGSLAEFQAILSADSRHTLSGNAQYWIGECHYAQKKYDQAVVDFEKVFTYVNTPKKDDSQFKLGLCYLRMKDYNHAKEELNRLISNYPESEYISKAKELLNQIGSK